MNTMINHKKKKTNQSKKPNAVDYRRLPIFDIIEKIAYGDREALDHFLARRKLFYCSGKWLLLSDYIRILSRTATPRFITSAIRDQEEFENLVYDLTLQRFIPLTDADSLSWKEEKTDVSGDASAGCFKLFKLVLERIKLWRTENQEASQLAEEQHIGMLFQGLVKRHFRFSMKDAHRKANSLQIRYTWHLETGSIPLYHPSWITGNEFRKCLDEDIDDPDPDRPGEKDRIQRVVDKHFGVGTFEPLDKRDEPYTNPEIHESTANTLIHRVAIKKELEFEQLRPAIRALGKRTVKELVVQILEDIAYGEYNSTHILEEYSLSKSALSRFAGNRWDNSPQSAAEHDIPDLWRNVAEVIMSDRDCIEAALSAKVKTVLQTIMDRSGSADKGTE